MCNSSTADHSIDFIEAINRDDDESARGMEILSMQSAFITACATVCCRGRISYANPQRDHNNYSCPTDTTSLIHTDRLAANDIQRCCQ